MPFTMRSVAAAILVVAALATGGCSSSSSSAPGGSAAFSEADLTGTWYLTFFPGAPAGFWARYTGVVDPDGIMSITAAADMRNDLTGLHWQRVLVVDDAGFVGLSDVGLAGFLGKMARSKQLIVGTGTSTGAGSAGLYIFQKKVPGVSFTQADLAGTWAYHQLVVGPGRGWGRGVAVVSSLGAVTLTTQTEWTGATNTNVNAGTLSIDAEGVVSATGSGMKGFMSGDKQLVVLTETRGPNEAGLTILLPLQGSYAQADLAGDWYLHQVYSTSSGGFWERAHLSVNATGAASFPWFMNQTGINNDVPPVTLTLSPTGVITQPSPADTSIQGNLRPGKDLYVATMTIDPGGAPTTGELSIGVR
jgi:hypothetical protein